MQINLLFSQKAHLVMCLLLIILSACQDEVTTAPQTTPSTSQNELALLEDTYKQDLLQTINYLDALLEATHHDQQVEAYKNSRNLFKKIEPILSAIDKDNYKTLNGPNLIKVHEEDATDIKVATPYGFQVIEETLFDMPLDTAVLYKVTKQTKNRLHLLHNNAHLQLDDRHVLWLVRDAIIRVATMGITGFDSSVLGNSLAESIIVYEALADILELYKDRFGSPALLAAWKTEIQKTTTTLNADFDTFDRYHFIQTHTHPQLELWVQTVADWQVEYKFELAIKHDATSLFTDSTFNLKHFADHHNDPYDKARIALGKKLFNDVALSKDNAMSCATCHQKDKAFTDGLATFPKQTRNSPTLAYAALQQSFFHDARAGSLEGQIVGVVNNPNEFHTNLADMTTAVKANKDYQAAFEQLYGGKITDNNIRNAIATYIRDLAPFNSKFDKNINKVEHTLTTNEINGFNLFMGKAACATCHFPPTFNGTVPPHFTESEMEMLGTLETPNQPKIDADLGRYELFKTAERKFFFKTPTVRNASLTGPYMHHGGYETLEQVVEFYNHGGGAGIGLDLPLQTLPADSLHLTKQEIQDIVSFMESLEDDFLK